jgi:4-diphosphocytidyl-2-C-methyl-D-erythritol kinase
MKPLIIKAHAKLNLCLSVTGRRRDGYHDIDSVFHCISLHDELTFSRRKDGIITLGCSDPGLPVDGTNLVLRAAAALKNLAAPKPSADDPGADIFLRKGIPAGAGLGGGSSDAAAALLGLRRLWGLDRVSPAEIRRLAETLGSDVPFFLSGGTAHVTGRGERVRPVPCPKRYHFVLIYPGFPVSTAWAYKNHRQLKNRLTNRGKFSKILLELCRSAEPASAWSRCLWNDLEPVVLSAHPEIARAKAALLDCGALGSLMSGSGSCVFGLFPGPGSAAFAHRKISQLWPHSYLSHSVAP